MVPLTSNYLRNQFRVEDTEGVTRNTFDSTILLQTAKTVKERMSYFDKWKSLDKLTINKLNCFGRNRSIYYLSQSKNKVGRIRNQIFKQNILASALSSFDPKL